MICDARERERVLTVSVLTAGRPPACSPVEEHDAARELWGLRTHNSLIVLVASSPSPTAERPKSESHREMISSQQSVVSSQTVRQ